MYLQCGLGDVVHLLVALGHCEQVVYVHEFVNLDLVCLVADPDFVVEHDYDCHLLLVK